MPHSVEVGQRPRLPHSEPHRRHTGANRFSLPAIGPEVSIRPIQPCDWRRLQVFHSRLSPETVHARFHAMKRDLTEPLAHRFTTQDGRDLVAVVATMKPDDRIVGVARYSRIDAHTAEVAFVVEDAYQGRGIGTELMRALRRVALRNGVQTFVAEILPDNVRMRALLHASGVCREQTRNGEVTVSLAVGDPEGSS